MKHTVTFEWEDDDPHVGATNKAHVVTALKRAAYGITASGIRIETDAAVYRPRTDDDPEPPSVSWVMEAVKVTRTLSPPD